jgi:murein L,D-transpeptidase YcbB/YkuD
MSTFRSCLGLPHYGKQTLFAPSIFRTLLVLLIAHLTLASIVAKAATSNAHKNSLEWATCPEAMSLGSERVYYADSLYKFYARRNFTPVWVVNNNVPVQTTAFLDCIADSRNNGLLPDDYHYNTIAYWLQLAAATPLHPDTLLNLDLLLSDAYLLLAKHYARGKVNPEKANIMWHLMKKSFNPIAYFENTLRKGTNLCESLELLLPDEMGYKELRNTLKQYETMSEWQTLSDKRGYSLWLQKGEADPLVAQVKQRLQITNDYPSHADTDIIFDKDLETAIMNFQRRHGLHYDGVIKLTTLQALNVPLSERINQIKANLERWRWMPENLGKNCIVVNIPGFELEMIQNDQIVYRESVIVGRENYPTPSFSDTVTHIIFNPFWYIPRSIVNAELKPTVLFDPEYLINNEVRVIKSGKTVNARAIDWKKANWDDYTFAQAASAYNPMGVVKFMFPNKHDIYIHDTPNHDLFNNARRSFSHGCVRVNDPVKFASFLLQYNEGWDSTHIKQVLFSQKETKVNLSKSIPIHLLYWTTYIDEQTAMLNFREDLYKWDAQLAAELNKKWYE